jgi:hypothetical protein
MIAIDNGCCEKALVVSQGEMLVASVQYLERFRDRRKFLVSDRKKFSSSAQIIVVSKSESGKEMYNTPVISTMGGSAP